jgi:hypothetical protein
MSKPYIHTEVFAGTPENYVFSFPCPADGDIRYIRCQHDSDSEIAITIFDRRSACPQQPDFNTRSGKVSAFVLEDGKLRLSLDAPHNLTDYNQKLELLWFDDEALNGLYLPHPSEGFVNPEEIVIAWDGDAPESSPGVWQIDPQMPRFPTSSHQILTVVVPSEGFSDTFEIIYKCRDKLNQITGLASRFLWVVLSDASGEPIDATVEVSLTLAIQTLRHVN